MVVSTYMSSIDSTTINDAMASAEELFRTDYKQFHIAEKNLGVSQITCVGADAYLSRKQELLDFMEQPATTRSTQFGSTETRCGSRRPSRIAMYRSLLWRRSFTMWTTTSCLLRLIMRMRGLFWSHMSCLRKQLSGSAA